MHEPASDLARFAAAQDPIYPAVLKELAAGRKRGHWMWFVFPQLYGLGHSAMAIRYALTGIDAARAYLLHPVLGARLRECTGLVIGVDDASVHQIFGSPDDLKFHSSMTLFRAADDDEPLFAQALDKFFAGNPDRRTLDMLRGAARV